MMVKFEFVKEDFRDEYYADGVYNIELQDCLYCLPERKTKGSAGYDFFAPHDFLIPAGGTTDLIKMGIKAIMPKDMYLGIHIRSSMAAKHDIILVNLEPIIDSDYANNAENDGNIMLKFRNLGNKDYLVRRGDRICQGIFKKYYVTDDDSADNERVGGYGSTGK